MAKPLRLTLAKHAGERLVNDMGIDALPIDPHMIAKRHGIVVQAKPETADGVSGMLLRHGNEFAILYATNITNEGFQRFSIAHELGHYFLDGHVDHIFAEHNVHTSRANFVSVDPYEREADQFAVGLLMPCILFGDELRRTDPGLGIIERLSSECHTSLTATALRLADLTEDAVAVIQSTGGAVDFCVMSSTMKTLRELTWPKRGSPIPRNTLTSRFNTDRDRVAYGDRIAGEIDVMDWFGGTRSAQAMEEVIGLGSSGRTLTILTCPAVKESTYEDGETDDDEELIESWTPRFRK